MQGVDSRTGMAGQAVATGLNPAKPISSYDMAALMRLLGQKMDACKLHGSVDPLMDFIFASMMEGANYIAHIPIACRKGCSFCCVLFVDATPPEVLYTVKTMPPKQREKALAAVQRVCATTSGVSFEDRCGKVNVPCPLLNAEGACSVYESRPVACRTLVSSNAEDCRRTFIEGSEEGFPAPDVWFTLRDSYNNALEGALIHAGLPYQAREWNESLRIAMTTPDAEARWLSGIDDFQDAVMAPAPTIFRQPLWQMIYSQAFGAPPPQL